MLFKSAMPVALSLIVITLAFGFLKNPLSNQDAAKAIEQDLAADKKKSQLTARELDDAATPVVDLYSSSTAAVSTDRLSKNRRHDNEGIVKSEIDPGITNVFRDPLEDISDLPTDKSELIVEGRVTDSAAFLSSDRGAVYSEFSVEVSDVLKDTSGLKVSSGHSIVTERLGGRVKYPNGQIIRYGIVGQGSPAKGKNYLFFLSRAEQGNYNILTAYELQGNKVQALDGARVNLGIGNWVFDKHNDEDYQTFRKGVEQAAKNPPSGNQSFTHRQRSELSPKTHRRIRWAYVASCSPSTTTTTSSSSRACAPTALSSSAKSRSTRTSTDSVSSVALRASSSGSSRNSAEASLEI
jgi:hypothetical protein